MLEIAKRTGMGALVLIILPLLVWVSGWQWHPDDQAGWWRLMYWVTQTVTAPWGSITSAVLLAWFLWCLRYRLKPALGLACILAAMLVAGQGLKSAIKDRVQEPRPYVLWLEHSYAIDDRAFYALPRKARSALVEQQLQDRQHIPSWLRRHWQHETGFAFPSGHTIFAVTWALLGVGLLWPRRHVVSVALMLLWAEMVMVSRLILGMHWPRDLIVGTLLGWLIITLGCWLVQRWIGPLTPKPDEARDIKSRA